MVVVNGNTWMYEVCVCVCVAQKSRNVSSRDQQDADIELEESVFAQCMRFSLLPDTHRGFDRCGEIFKIANLVQILNYLLSP